MGEGGGVRQGRRETGGRLRVLHLLVPHPLNLLLWTRLGRLGEETETGGGAEASWPHCGSVPKRPRMWGGTPVLDDYQAFDGDS